MGARRTLLDVKNMKIEKFNGEDEDPTFFVKWIDSLRGYADATIPGMARAMIKCETAVDEVGEAEVNRWAIPGVTYDLHATMLYKFLKAYSTGKAYNIVCTQRSDENGFKALHQMHVQCDLKLNHRKADIRQAMAMFNARRAATAKETRTLLRELENKAMNFHNVVGEAYDDQSLRTFAPPEQRKPR